MTKRILWLLTAAAVLCSCGTGAKPSPHAKGFRAVKKLFSEAQSKLDGGEFNGALKAADDFAKAADKLVLRIPPGDPYREKTRALIADGRKLRDDIAEKKLRAEKEEVKVASGKKPLDYKEFWGEEEEKQESSAGRVDPALLARREAEAAKKAADEQRERTALADMAARQREVVARQKLGEIDEEALKKAEKQRSAQAEKTDPLAKPKIPKDKITDDTKPLQRLKICRKGKSVIVYVLLTNKTDKPFRVGSVTGELLDGGENFVDRVGMAFEGDGFKPNWDNVFESEGKAITAESLLVDPKSKKMLALVAEHQDAGRVAKVRLSVPTDVGGFFHGPD